MTSFLNQNYELNWTLAAQLNNLNPTAQCGYKRDSGLAFWAGRPIVGRVSPLVRFLIKIERARCKVPSRANAGRVSFIYWRNPIFIEGIRI